MTVLVVTADDFGAATEVNEAVEMAHRRGILTAASLMVAAPAAADAVERARRLPRLGVGLHLVLVDGRPLLPTARVPELVGPDGRFVGDLHLAFRLATSGRTRRQCRAEIDAQFAAFTATGLPFDHVNAHRHFHVHPVVAGMVLDAAARHGVRALRAPVETGRPRGSGWLAAPFAAWLRRRARARGMLTPDRVVGLADSGRMTVDRLVAALQALGDGLSEVYLHPAYSDDFPGHGDGYRHRDEFAALVSERSRETVAAFGIRLTSFRGVETR